MPIDYERCNICPGCKGEIQKTFQILNLTGTQDLLFLAFAEKTRYSIKAITEFMANQLDVDTKLLSRGCQNKNVPKKEMKLLLFQTNRLGCSHLGL